MLKAISFNPGVPDVVFFDNSQITRIEYDFWILRITLECGSQDGPVYLEFRRIAGFRVLDEGELCAFWDSKTRVDGWLWEIKSGGWFDLESTRSDFPLNLPALASRSGEPTGLKEFLVLGEDDCVSVITWANPCAYSALP